MPKYEPIHYHDYLGLDQLLSSQKRRSEEFGAPAKDEYLFITVHQVYELWFKQIIFELDQVLEVFAQGKIDEREMGTAVRHLDRVTEIQRLLLAQVDVIETMTPMDFLEFREMLYPASGFQSFQFRAIETKLGLKNRLQYSAAPFTKHLTETQARQIEKWINEPSLFDLLEKWLERTPFLKQGSFDFWENYKAAVYAMFERDRDVVRTNTSLSDELRRSSLEEIEKSSAVFEALFDENKYEELRSEKHWRLSYSSLHAALLILLYRDRPIFQMPFRLLEALLKVDENFTTWRYRHALMAHRMLGSKIGTGGSSGHKYLRQATEEHKIYVDLFNLSTFLIPRSQLPELPDTVEKKMNFQY